MAWNGYLYARIQNRETGEIIPVYRRLGKWRRYDNDEPVKDRALASIARRALDAADLKTVYEERRRTLAAQ